MLTLPILLALEARLSKPPTPRRAGEGGRGVRGGGGGGGANSGDSLRDLRERGLGTISRGVGLARKAGGTNGEISSTGNSTGDCGS